MRTLICSEASSPAASSSDGGVSWGGVGSVPASDGVLWSASPANARTSFPRRCTFRYQATGSTAKGSAPPSAAGGATRGQGPLCRRAAHLRTPPSIGARSSCSTGPRVVFGKCEVLFCKIASVSPIWSVCKVDPTAKKKQATWLASPASVLAQNRM